jgi:hypothetical protein
MQISATYSACLSTMRPAELYDVARLCFDTYKVLLSSFLVHNTPKKSCKIKYKKHFIPLRFSTLKNLQMKHKGGIWHYMLRPKMSS